MGNLLPLKWEIYYHLKKMDTICDYLMSENKTAGETLKAMSSAALIETLYNFCYIIFGH